MFVVVTNNERCQANLSNCNLCTLYIDEYVCIAPLKARNNEPFKYINIYIKEINVGGKAHSHTITVKNQ